MSISKIPSEYGPNKITKMMKTKLLEINIEINYCLINYRVNWSPYHNKLHTKPAFVVGQYKAIFLYRSDNKIHVIKC